MRTIGGLRKILQYRYLVLTSVVTKLQCIIIQTSSWLLRPREQLRSIVMSMAVCVSVCPRGYLRNRMRDLYQIFVHVAHVRGSVFLRHVDDRLHRLSAGRGTGVHSAGEVQSTIALYLSVTWRHKRRNENDSWLNNLNFTSSVMI